MAWLRNIYECSSCNFSWEDEWSCACDDDCPQCGATQIPAVDSRDLSVIQEHMDDGTIRVLFSPANAESSPNYIEINSLPSKAKADEMAKKVERL